MTSISIGIVFKIIVLYCILLIPQLRLSKRVMDPHIGNYNVQIVSKIKLMDIFFIHNFCFPLVTLCMSLQYKLFRENLLAYKYFHSFLISITGPLYYCFVFMLTGQESIAFMASLFYVSTHCLSINGNFLIQPEHYEILFFLAGASLSLSGIEYQNMGMLVVGCYIMGLTLLCKLPGLASIWILFILFYYYDAQNYIISIIAYLSPLLSYLIARKIYMVYFYEISIPLKKIKKSLTQQLKTIFDTYLYYFKRDPKKYFDIYIYYSFVQYVRCHLPMIFLTLFMYLKAEVHVDTLGGISSGFIILSLMFVMRMGFAYVYSFNMVLCIATAYGFQTFLTSNELLLDIVLCSYVFYAFMSIFKDPQMQSMYLKKTIENNDTFNAFKHIAQYIKKSSSPDESWFINVNNTVANVYLLADRGFSGPINYVMIGVFHPKIEHQYIPDVLSNEAYYLYNVFCTNPPTYILQLESQWPIINLTYLSSITGASYEVYNYFNSCLIFKIKEKRSVHIDQESIDLNVLFNAESAKAEMKSSIDHFNKTKEKTFANKHNDENSPEFFLKQAKFCSQNNNKKQAIQILINLLKQWPDYHLAYMELAVIHYQCGDSQSALNYLYHVYRLKPQEKSVVINLSNLLISLNMHSETKTILNQYLNHFPNDAEIIQMIQRLDN